MNTKLFLKISSIILITIVTIVSYFIIWPWVAIYIGTALLPNPPKPEITYGEFPFKLVYEINGETKVVEDTLICEYDGIGMNEGVGKFRKWKSHLASGNEKILLLNISGAPDLSYSNKKTIKQEIYYNSGPEDYYMGDMDEYEKYNHNFPNACFFEKYEDGSTIDGIIYADELSEKYNIKLISWDYTQPIRNNFIK